MFREDEMNTASAHRESRWERSVRWIALIAAGPVSFVRGLSAIVAMIRPA